MTAELRQYLNCAHIMVSPMGRRFPSSVDEALRKLGHQRHVRVCVPQYLTAAQLAAATDLVVTVPASIAQRSAQLHGLAVQELPFQIDPLELYVVWHERSHHDRAHRWLREELKEVAARL